jgi:hypothetical protein
MAATQELAVRSSNGIEVSLLWSRPGNSLTVLVWDERLGESFTLPARRDNALDVFYHPYAYASH